MLGGLSHQASESAVDVCAISGCFDVPLDRKTVQYVTCSVE